MSSVANQMAKGSADNSGLGKYRISQPGDALELEADQFADEVLRMPDAVAAKFAAGAPLLQRKCAACKAGGSPCPACSLGGETTLPRFPTRRLQRRPITEEEGQLQLQRQGTAPLNSGVSQSVNAVEAVRSGGAPLPIQPMLLSPTALVTWYRT